jgi:hypothetical protein
VTPNSPEPLLKYVLLSLKAQGLNPRLTSHSCLAMDVLQLIREEVEYLTTMKDAGQLSEPEWKELLDQHQAATICFPGRKL